MTAVNSVLAEDGRVAAVGEFGMYSHRMSTDLSEVCRQYVEVLLGFCFGRKVFQTKETSSKTLGL